MQVLVTGTTGLLGEAIVAELRSCGYSVRAMVRSGRDATHLQSYGATLEFGNLDDLRSLRRASKYAQALVIAMPSHPLRRTRSSEQLHSQGIRNLITAAQEAAVSQVVLVSALKADLAVGVPELAFRYAAEQELRHSGLCYTIVRPAALQELFSDHYPLKRLIERYTIGVMPGQGKRPQAFVAATDVARTVRLALERPEACAAVLEVGGPEELSFREAYGRIAALRGRQLHLVPVSDPLLRFGTTLSRPLLPGAAWLEGLPTFFDRHDYTASMLPWLAEALGRRRCFDERMDEIFGLVKVERQPQQQPHLE